MSTALGLLMVAASAIGSAGGGRAAMVLAVAATVGVVAGVRFAAGATCAVVCTAVLLAVSGPESMAALLTGLAAAAYLVLRQGGRADEFAVWPSLIGALGVSAAVLLAAVVPVRVAWLPLAAPLAGVIVYVIVMRPMLAGRPTQVRRDPGLR